ncbi:uncharacterized protein BCR38DRAFT_414242 [Pseudomassariella vexata]|uniref:Uncharacterized protein n=1 Tax=Pseudomassariella vexata TaxID=1141098 RepID=A0A1Y2DCK4_9PEZI|nr:uncharacterized protein BCR38DRAFT_414242 [Pseudomassariella vexata]ORY56927.1 hypothetical protein BCR38DRAFT_414242 [Pseudomassariella vexata]
MTRRTQNIPSRRPRQDAGFFPSPAMRCFRLGPTVDFYQTSDRRSSLVSIPKWKLRVDQHVANGTQPIGRVMTNEKPMLRSLLTRLVSMRNCKPPEHQLKSARRPGTSGWFQTTSKHSLSSDDLGRVAAFSNKAMDRNCPLDNRDRAILAINCLPQRDPAQGFNNARCNATW